jgi:hypothetical protein
MSDAGLETPVKLKIGEHNADRGCKANAVRFQLMVILACIWSTIFCVSAGILVWLPGYVLGHVALLLIGIFGTTWAFKSAATFSDVS